MEFTYTGEQVDAESGLVYLRARYYDPAIGRFQTADPIQGNTMSPSSLHAYAYAFSKSAPVARPDRQERRVTLCAISYSKNDDDPGRSGECRSIARLIENLVSELAFRFGDMDYDRDRLYENYHWSDGPRHPRSGTTWEGAPGAL
ncbi:MAG: RHS repeat-associated core domain-containing protein [Dehalococcoidia bacterium]